MSVPKIHCRLTARAFFSPSYRLNAGIQYFQNVTTALDPVVLQGDD